MYVDGKVSCCPKCKSTSIRKSKVYTDRLNRGKNSIQFVKTVYRCYHCKGEFANPIFKDRKPNKKQATVDKRFNTFT